MADRPPPLDRLVNLDFEASCYPSDGRSFPIEVAAVRLADDAARAWLIRPHAKWATWTWDEAAAAVHGLTREQLARDGLPAAQVLAELAAFVAGLTVVSDSESDAGWLDTLSGAAGVPPPFAIGSSAHVLKLLGITGQTQADETWQRADAVARAHHPQAHRAEPDARRGAEIIRLVARWNGFA